MLTLKPPSLNFSLVKFLPVQLQLMKAMKQNARKDENTANDASSILLWQRRSCIEQTGR